MKAIALKYAPILLMVVLLNYSMLKVMIPPPVQVVSIDMKSVINDFVVQNSQDDSSQEALERSVEEFASNLERLKDKIEILARDGGFIVLPSQAVITGVDDVTDQVKLLLQDLQTDKVSSL